MANLEAQPKWSSVRLLEAHELARGGLNGNMNEQAKALAERTEFLNQEKASKSEIVQGVFEFGTYALFDAAKSTLPLNCTVVIGEENTTGSGQWGIGNNIWNGSVLKKSSFDPFEKSKTYTNEIAEKINREIGLYTLRSNYCYIGTEGQPIAGSTTYTTACVKMEVKAGDNFHLKTKGLNHARPYYLTNLSDVVVYVAAENFTVTDFNVTVAEDGFLYVNCDNTVLSQLSIYKFREKELEHTEQINALSSRLSKVSNLFSKVSGKAYVVSGDKALFQNSSLVFCIAVPVVEGEKFYLKTKGVGVARGYFFVDSANTILLSEAGSEVKIRNLTAPANSAYLYVNCDLTYQNSFALEFLNETSHRISKATGGMDSYFTDDLPAFTQTVTSVDEKVQVLFSRNPRILNSSGEAAYLFPSDATEFYLEIPKYGILYVDNLVNNNWNETPFLAIADIKSLSNLESLDFRGRTILAINQKGTLINFGAIGHKYYDDLIKKVPNALTRITLLESNPQQGLKSYYPPAQNYVGALRAKCPKFYNKFRNKTGDVVVCITGSSLTQGNLYTTTRSDATTRPPLLHTNDLASHIFDVLINYWNGQQYRRYDHSDLIYSDSVWSVINALTVEGVAIWDDGGAYKNGLTKTTLSPNASVSMIIPADAWQFNFIYRTDSQGGACTISIAEGSSKVEVFNGSAWVEANGYVFSMLEPAKTATKGNTIYQKRLKMRCKNKLSGGIDSIGQTKQITIAKTNDTSRFNVVGFEWSPREYMFTFINAARGAHQWGFSGGAINLETLQDGDVWEFKPDLIICETTVGNWGGNSPSALTIDPLYFVNLAKTAYFNGFGNNPDSLYEKSSQYTDCEIVFYGGTMSAATAHAAAWDEVTKQPKWGLVTVAASNGDGSTVNVGRRKTNFENYEAVEAYMSLMEDYIYVPVMSVFKEVGEKVFPTYWHSFQASGESGNTFTKDGTHLNDNGAALWAHLITPVFRNM